MRLIALSQGQRSGERGFKKETTIKTPLVENANLTANDFVIPAVGQVHLPSLVSPEGQKEVARAEKEEEKQGKPEEDAPTSKRAEPARIKIFEGG